MNDLQKKIGNNVTFLSAQFTAANTMDKLNLPIDTNKKKNQVDLPSIRFDLKLEKPSSDKFSEFNFNKLCLKTFKSMKKINKKNKSDNPSDKLTVITNNDLSIIDGDFRIEKKRVNELLATFRNKAILSKEMDREEGEESNEFYDDEYTNESEVNVKNSKKKKKFSKGLNGLDVNKFRYADFSHLGKGYDESDSFIDNSDAQDVHIPKNLVPKRGGFYINRERLKLATIDEVKKSKKSSKKDSDENSEQDESEGDSEEYSESEDSDFEDSEDESENSEDDDEEEEEEGESEDGESDEDDEEKDKTEKAIKIIPEIDLASSNSTSCEAISNINVKKSKKILDDDEHEDNKQETNPDENNDIIKNKENKLIVNPEQSIVNTKKRKNDSQSNDLIINSDKIQVKITQSHEDISEVEVSNFKKKKLESTIEQPKPIMNIQILNEKNRLLNQSNIDNKGKGDDSNDYIDVEEENQNQANKSHLTDTSMINNSLNRSNLNQTLPNQNPCALPEALTNDFRAVINKFVDLYSQKMNSTSEPMTVELKTILLGIYNESKRLKFQSQIFNYLSFKTGRNKDSLFRVCRRILNKETTSSQQPNALNSSSNEQITNTPTLVTKPHSFVTPNIPTPVQTKTDNDIPLKLKQSPPSSPQFTFNDLDEEIKAKLLNLKKEYLISKQKQEVSKFLESPQIHSLIYSVDLSSRKTNRNPSRVRDFCISFLSESFEISKDVFFKKYNSIVTQMRHKSLENNLKNKLNELKKEIDFEMPKNWDKFSKNSDEFNRNKMNEPNEELRKKMNPPRRKFEFTDKIRELILSIIQVKMSLFRTSINSPSPQNSQNDASVKLNYIDNFFETELIPLWPKNWMQKNVLLNFYQIKYCQQQQFQQQRVTPGISSSQPVNKTPVAPTTPVSTLPKQPTQTSSVINISSKNGKSIKIESHNPTPGQNTLQSPQVVLSRVNVSSTPKSINQATVSQINQPKSNVYETVVNQHKKKPVPTNTSFNNSMHIEELYSTPNTSQKVQNKSPHNLFQISNLINSTAASSNSSLNDLNKLQQHLNFMLPNFVQNSSSLPNITQNFSNPNNN